MLVSKLGLFAQTFSSFYRQKKLKLYWTVLKNILHNQSFKVRLHLRISRTISHKASTFCYKKIIFITKGASLVQNRPRNRTSVNAPLHLQKQPANFYSGVH